jgi:hypothetical protein
MNTENERFEKLNDFLWKCPCDFCMVYRVKKNPTDLKLKWCKAISLNKQNHEGYEKLAAKYQKVAEHCYQHKRNLILKENLPSATSSSQDWCGLKIPVGAIDNPPPANSIGKRWWHLVVGSGIVRDTGYIIVTRIAAKEANEVRDCIKQLERIWID